MTAAAPAQPGMALDDIDTPALVVDLDALELNLACMAEALGGLPVRLRPHAKTHKSPDIALRQLALGAVGVCCQKVSEAEALVDGGVGDVLVSNEVVGARKLERLAALAQRAHVSVCVDHPAAVAELARVASGAGVRLDTLVEVDVGAARCGVPPGAPAVDLARAVQSSGHLRFAGLQAYHGAAQHLRSPAERKAAVDTAVDRVRRTLAELARAGIECEAVTGGGTGTFLLEAQSGAYTEIQPGSYVFMDADYSRNSQQDGWPRFRQSLFVLATVMSRPVPERAVTDAGLKALSVDSGLPLVHDLPGARYARASDEHGVIELDAAARNLALGERVMLVPGHCDPTVNLHDWYVGVRGNRVESVWPVAARGALY